MKGMIEKKIADKFVVCGKLCVARGLMKKQGLYVGDEVEFDGEKGVINKIYERKNLLIRPPIANVDKMIIVIAESPKPDFNLVDKLIIFCQIHNISPVLCVNKSDALSEGMKAKVQRIYQSVLPIIFTSASCSDVKELEIEGLCAFAGQSAVGKSSLLNALHGQQIEQVGELSKRVERGKQTTRVVTLYKFEKGYIADTAGFSKLDEKMFNIDKKELAGYFSEFKPYIPKCYFTSCAHIKDKGCAVKNAVAEGKISQERYDSYKKIYEVLKEVNSYEKKG